MSGLAQRPTEIDFYFDPICPWAFQTSLWIREVSRLTNLRINWKFFSLEEINRTEGKKHPWEREIAYGWTPMRIAALLRRRDNALCGEWYLRAATALQSEAVSGSARCGWPLDIMRSVMSASDVPIA